ncbi:MAG: acyltransferase family protein [Gammaproteobacteria bacterium]
MVEGFDTRRDDIQGLRALAVISVILFHAGVSGFAGGFLGVDVFFAISGYLMAQIIHRDVVQGSFRLRDFYLRRARRILPALYVTLVLCCVASWFVQFPAEFEDFADALAGSVLFLANAVLMNQSSGYFAVTLENQPLLHMWSLSVEEQFYLLFPVFFLLLLGLDSRFRVIVLAFTGLASLGLAQVYFAESPSATFFHLPGRIFEFLVGVLAFEYRRQQHPTPRIVSKVSEPIGITIIVGSMVFMDKTTQLPSVLSLIPLAGSFMILAFARPSGDTILTQRVLVYLGGVSFSLYLLHQPILAYARLSGFDSAVWLGALLLVSVPLAATMKKFVEDPCRDSGRVKTGIFLSVVGLSSVGLISLALYSKQADGVPDRFSGQVRSAVKTAVGSPVREKCSTDGWNYLPPEKACWFRPDQPSWVVFGDSHSNEFAYALQDYLESADGGVWHLSFSGCSTAFGRDQEDPCHAWTRDVLKTLESNKQKLKGVIVSTRLQASLHGRHEDIYPEIPDRHDPAMVSEHWLRFKTLMKSFMELGLPVVWVRQAPEVPSHINTVIRNLDSPDAAGVPRAWWERRREWSSERLGELAPSLVILDPAESFCDESICYAIRHGTSWYRDRDHMSVAGARKLIEENSKLW